MIFRIFNQYIPIRRIFLFAGESVFIIGITMLCAGILSAGADEAAGNLHPFIGALVITFAVQVCLYYFELYDFKIFRSNLELMIRLLQSLGFAMIVLAAAYFFFPELMTGKGVFLPGAILISTGVICWRFLYNAFLKMQYIDQRILILGTGKLARSIAEQILYGEDSGFNVVGFTSHEPKRIGEVLVNPSIIGSHSQIESICARKKVHRVIVANEDRRGALPLDQLLQCKTKGIKIEEGIEFYEHLTGKLDIDHLNPSFMIFSNGFKKTKTMTFIKRTADLVLSSAGVVLTAPIMLLTALLIKLESPGPVFYKQERVGENGSVFSLIKFRSMRDHAEADGPVWAGKNDDRVTRIGKWLRKGRIDELPQMFNVLRGDMSFVGPRPERPHFVKKLGAVIPYYDQRSCVPPGITGWAQVRYPYGASIRDAAEKLKYDLYYIKNMSFAFDLFIIFETLKTVLFGKGAR
jgi:sugar transferase (PEP-CTERM system associated)